MLPRLGIVVPYRDRQQHLDEFLPRLQQFFVGDDAGKAIPYRILIAEQAPGLPFNRGAVLNIGFKYLASDTEYVCFHDVDRVPVTADYSWPAAPAMLMFHGLPFKPDMIRQLFSGVTLMQNAHFAAANGFSNDYWGWGFEDVDLRERLLRCGLKPEHREGTFTALPHVDAGSHPDGTPTPAHRVNQKRYTDRWFKRVALPNTRPFWTRLPEPAFPWREEGLNSLAFSELAPLRRIGAGGPGAPIIEHVAVALHDPGGIDVQ
jgi:hypothetical protein